MATEFRGTPGVSTGSSLTSRIIFDDPTKVEYGPSLRSLDGAKSRDPGSVPSSLLRAGLLLGKITSGGKYRPSVIGLTTADYTSGGTSLTVPAAVATEVARLIVVTGGNVSLKIIGPPSAAGTVAITSATASAASGTTITVANLGVNKASGCLVTPADGSEIPLTLLPNPFGIDVADSAGASIDQPLPLLARKASLITASIINYAGADTSVQAWIKTQLRATGVFTFDDER